MIVDFYKLKDTEVWACKKYLIQAISCKFDFLSYHFVILGCNNWAASSSFSFSSEGWISWCALKHHQQTWSSESGYPCKPSPVSQPVFFFWCCEFYHTDTTYAFIYAVMQSYILLLPIQTEENGIKENQFLEVKLMKQYICRLLESVCCLNLCCQQL